MKCIILDIKTTGIPTRDTVLDFSNCRLVQIGWIIATVNFNIKKYIIHKYIQYMCNDNSYRTSKEAFNIHHISDEYRIKNGKSISYIFKNLVLDCIKVQYIISHGIKFDINVICHEAQYIFPKDYVIAFEYLFSHKTLICTKKSPLYYKKSIGLFKLIKEINPYYKVPNNKLLSYDALYNAYLCLELLIYSSAFINNMIIDILIIKNNNIID